MPDDLKKLKAFDAKLEWPVRILFTMAVVYTVVRASSYEEHYYYEGSFGLTLIALWCYFFKFRMLSVCALLLQLFLAWAHTGNG